MQAPGLMEASALSARAQFLGGGGDAAMDSALRRAQDVLRVNPAEPSMHLLVCR